MTDTTYRNRHYRGHFGDDSYHTGDAYASFVELSSAIGSHPVGTSLETLIADIDARLSAMENTFTESGAFSIAAFIQPYFSIDAYIKAHGFTLDAYVANNFSLDAYVAPYFTLDARLAGAFSLDAYIAHHFSLDAYIAHHFLLDAWIASTNSTFSIDAYVAQHFSLDAWLAGRFSIDAYVAHNLTLDAYIAHHFALDAYIVRSFTLDAYIANNFSIDAYVAHHFSVDAYIAGAFTIDARIANYFSIDAKIFDYGTQDYDFTVDAELVAAPSIPTFVSSSGTGYIEGVGTTITPALPAGIQTGDILIAHAATIGTQGAPSMDSGDWTQIASYTVASTSGGRNTLWWHRYDGTDPNRAMTGAGDYIYGIIAAYRGCVPTGTPYEALQNTAKGSGAITWDTTVPTTSDYCLIVVTDSAGDNDNNWFSWSPDTITDATIRKQYGSSSGNDGWAVIADGGLETAGDIGTISISTNGPSSEFHTLILFALIGE